MAALPDDLRERTLAYYRERFAEHGASPRGVDWNSHASQRTLFEQMLKLLPVAARCSLNDWGCGYGALVDALPAGVDYRGCDVNPAMIEAAIRLHAGRADARFDVADEPPAIADYGVASGLFALRLERTDERCFADLAHGIATLAATSRLGFAFNCLTAYSDADRMQPHLYYPDPCAVFDLCKRRHARNVALLHDYDLYSFTILVRKVVQ